MTTTPRPTDSALEPAADTGPDTAQTLFDHQLRGTPLVLVASPPGAGKSTLVVDLAARCAAAGDSVAIVTVTNNQAAHLAERVADRLAASDPPVLLSIGRDAPDPYPNGRPARVQLTREQPPALPEGGVAVACAAKWTWAPDTGIRPPFDVMIVDEAWMLAWGTFHLIANLARRHVLVGDPGQIAPFSPAAQERWHGDPTGPLVPAAHAARHRQPHAPLLLLPRSWRLPHDTVSVIQPALYPDLPFTAGLPAGYRSISHYDHDGPVRRVETEPALPSLRAVRLPHTPADPTDLAGCRAAAQAAGTALHRVRLHEPTVSSRLRLKRLAIAVSRHRQAAAVRQALAADLATHVTVGTINALQGLEFDYVIALDPLAGASTLTPFLLEQGRLCVALTRHRYACEFLTRDRVTDLLRTHRPNSPRYLGADPDPEYLGLHAHLRLRAALGLM